MAAGTEGELRVDLGALRRFAAAVESELESLLAARGDGLAARFFPTGRDPEQRHFGRSRHHRSGAAIGRAQHANAAAHLDRLAQAREGLVIARRAAVLLLERYRDLDASQELTAAAVTDALAEVRAARDDG